MKSFQDFISEAPNMEVSKSTLRAREQRDANRENIKKLQKGIRQQNAQRSMAGVEAPKKRKEREEIKREVEDEVRRERGC